MFDLSDKTGDPKDWARRILNRHESGEELRPITLRFACEALGVPVPDWKKPSFAALRKGVPA
jgi:hypothetical protein